MILLNKYIALPCIIIAVLMCHAAAAAHNAASVPGDSICRTYYNMQINFKEAYLSGICVMVESGDEVVSCLVNEFGVTLLSFVYNIQEGTVKLGHTIKPISKWYIKRTLKKDLKAIMPIILQGGNSYYNKKKNISYSFDILKESGD